MNKKFSITSGIVLAMIFGITIMPASTSASTIGNGPAVFFQDNCVVTGTNNTPLNVRRTPNGRIIGSLKLGAHIVAYDLVQDSNGNDWTKIKFGRGFGYVSTQFISCG
jgi:hypothetical protein